MCLADTSISEKCVHSPVREIYIIDRHCIYYTYNLSHIVSLKCLSNDFRLIFALSKGLYLHSLASSILEEPAENQVPQSFPLLDPLYFHLYLAIFFLNIRNKHLVYFTYFEASGAWYLRMKCSEMQSFPECDREK